MSTSPRFRFARSFPDSLPTSDGGVGHEAHQGQCRGLDVHRDSVVACCRVVGLGGEVEITKGRFPTTRKGLGELAGFLSGVGVATVATEATGVYWKCVYYALEGLVPEVWLCNAQRVKNVSGSFFSLTGAQAFAAIRSYLQTANNHHQNLLGVLGQLFTEGPWLPPYPAGGT